MKKNYFENETAVSRTWPDPYDVQVKIKKVHSEAKIPTYAHDDDACCDLYTTEDYTIHVGQRVLMSTGIAIEMPWGYEVQIRPRSGLAFKKGMTVLNTPGTIDAGYRNEVRVIAVNLGSDVISVRKGDRIAQMSIKPVYKMSFEEVDELSNSERGLGGCGSTGN